MNTNDHRDLSRRERQILDILYQRGQATAAEVQTGAAGTAELLGGPRAAADSRRKGTRPARAGRPALRLPADVARDNAQRSALRHILQTFFDGSAEQAISALLDDSVGRSFHPRNSIASRA